MSLLRSSMADVLQTASNKVQWDYLVLPALCLARAIAGLAQSLDRREKFNCKHCE